MKSRILVILLGIGLITSLLSACAYNDATNITGKVIGEKAAFSNQEILEKYSHENIPGFAEIHEQLNINYEDLEEVYSYTELDANKKVQTYTAKSPNDLPTKPDSAIVRNFYDKNKRVIIQEEYRYNFLQSIDVYEYLGNNSTIRYSYNNSDMYTEPVIEHVLWMEDGKNLASASYSDLSLKRRELCIYEKDRNRYSRRFVYDSNGYPSYCLVYEYDSDETYNASKILTYNMEEALQSYEKFSYSDNGKISNSYLYDANENLIREGIHNSDGTYKGYVKHEYQDGKRIKSSYYKCNANLTSEYLTSYILYSYRPDGTLKEQQTFDAQGKQIK